MTDNTYATRHDTADTCPANNATPYSDKAVIMNCQEILISSGTAPDANATNAKCLTCAATYYFDLSTPPKCV